MIDYIFRYFSEPLLREVLISLITALSMIKINEADKKSYMDVDIIVLNYNRIISNGKCDMPCLGMI